MEIIGTKASISVFSPIQREKTTNTVVKAVMIRDKVIDNFCGVPDLMKIICDDNLVLKDIKKIGTNETFPQTH